MDPTFALGEDANRRDRQETLSWLPILTSQLSNRTLKSGGAAATHPSAAMLQKSSTYPVRAIFNHLTAIGAMTRDATL